MKKILLLLFIACATVVSAQRNMAPKAHVVAKTMGETMVRAYVVFYEKANVEALESAGAQVNSVAGSIATITIKASQLQDISAVEGVKYVQTGSEVTTEMDLARQETGVTKVHNGTSLDTPYTGNGVVIGFVDSGIDYTHPAFRDASGNLRIKRVWEQGTNSSSFGSRPKQGYGTQFTTQDAILRSQGDTNAATHGTHVMGIATGSNQPLGGLYSGVAPEADIVVVALSGTLGTGNNSVCVSDAIDYIFSYADEVQKPCVINLSLGTHTGPHDGTSVFDAYTDNVVGPGRIICGASGNYGIYKFHLQKTFAGADDTPLQTFIDFAKGGTTVSYNGGDIDIWSDASVDFEVSGLAYNTFTKAVNTETVIYPAAEQGQEFEFGRNVTGKLIVSSEISPLNGKRHVVITSAITGLRTNYALGLKITPKTAGTIDMWSDHSKLDLKSNNIEGFIEPTDEATITEIGGTGKRIISVGAYCSRDQFVMEGDPKVYPVGETLGDLYSFSGFGPTADGRVKPEVCAPGGYIIAAVSNLDQTGTLRVAKSFNYLGTTYKYGYLQGTSMSTPFVVGSVALWLQACPTLTPEQVKEILQQTSRSDKFTGDITADGSKKWGYGKIDVYAGTVAATAYTGIHDINMTDTSIRPSGCYDLQGRKLSLDRLPQHGMFIIGGRKVVR